MDAGSATKARCSDRLRAEYPIAERSSLLAGFLIAWCHLRHAANRLPQWEKYPTKIQRSVAEARHQTEDLQGVYGTSEKPPSSIHTRTSRSYRSGQRDSRI